MSLKSDNYVETLKSCFAMTTEDPRNRSVVFNDQTIHDLETLRCFAMTADPSTPNQNALKKS